jgi:hypothetical protein
MANTFETVVVAVTAVGIVLSFTRFFNPLSVAKLIGHIGSYFERPEDLPLAEQRDSSLNDPPIPFRPLRARP